jgi:hypothetical protein
MLIQGELINKLESGILSGADLAEYYEIYTKIANESEYLRDFCKDWNFGLKPINNKKNSILNMSYYLMWYIRFF